MNILLSLFFTARGSQDAAPGFAIVDNAEPVVEYREHFVEKHRVPHSNFAPRFAPAPELAGLTQEGTEVTEDPIVEYKENFNSVERVAHSPVLRPARVPPVPDGSAGVKKDTTDPPVVRDQESASPATPPVSYWESYWGSWAASKPSFENQPECPTREPSTREDCARRGLTCFYGEECCCGICRPAVATTCHWSYSRGRAIWTADRTNHCQNTTCGERSRLQCKFRNELFDQGQKVYDNFVCRLCTCGGDPANPSEMTCQATCNLRNEKFCWKYCTSENRRGAGCRYYCKRV